MAPAVATRAAAVVPEAAEARLNPTLRREPQDRRRTAAARRNRCRARRSHQHRATYRFDRGEERLLGVPTQRIRQRHSKPAARLLARRRRKRPGRCHRSQQRASAWSAQAHQGESVARHPTVRRSFAAASRRRLSDRHRGSRFSHLRSRQVRRRPKRVYLTGLSCGALGSASYFAQYGSEIVAASALIAGDATPIWNAKMCGFSPGPLLGLPRRRGCHRAHTSRRQHHAAEIHRCPKPPKTDAQYTVYPGVGHDSWTRTYDLAPATTSTPGC